MDPDPDPGGPKTCGSDGSGSGSATLVGNIHCYCLHVCRRANWTCPGRWVSWSTCSSPASHGATWAAYPASAYQALHSQSVNGVNSYRYLCTYDLYDTVRNAFDAGSIHCEGKWESVKPWKWHRTDRRVPFGAQKSLDFQCPTPSHLPS